MKVLHLISRLTTGGLPALASLLARQLAAGGVPGMVCTLQPARNARMHQELAERMPVRCLQRESSRDLRLSWDLLSVVRDYRPDVIQAHHYELRYLLPWIVAGVLPPVVFTLHQVMRPGEDAFEQLLYRGIFRLRIKPVAVSVAVADRLQELSGVRAEVIENGIDIDMLHRPTRSRAEWRSAHGLAGEDFVFTTLARFHPVKRLDLMIREFASVTARWPAAKLVIAGDGDLRPSLEALAAQLGLGARVRFLGYRDDTADILAASDAFLMTSSSEGNPMALMEALAAGLPVVCTAVGGIPQVIRDGRDGVLVPANPTPGVMATEMMRLIAEPQSRLEWSSRARARAVESFSGRKMAQSYADLYERVIDQRGSRGPKANL